MNGNYRRITVHCYFECVGDDGIQMNRNKNELGRAKTGYLFSFFFSNKTSINWNQKISVFQKLEFCVAC